MHASRDGRDLHLTTLKKDENGVSKVVTLFIAIIVVVAVVAVTIIILSESPSAPGAPNGLRANITGDSVTLTWNAPSNIGSGVVGYKVFRSNESGLYSTSPLAMVSTLGYTDNIGGASGYIYYVVKAYNSAGNSSSSSEVRIEATWVPNVGQYLDYSISGTSPTGNVNGTIYLMVKSVSKTSVIINQTVTINGLVVSSKNLTEQKDDVFRDMVGAISESWIFEGNISVSTNWGPLLCSHNLITSSDSTNDVYFYKNILVKSNLVEEMNGRYTQNAVLAATNIGLITGA